LFFKNVEKNQNSILFPNGPDLAFVRSSIFPDLAFVRSVSPHPLFLQFYNVSFFFFVSLLPFFFFYALKFNMQAG
jgi:hypothetical protein